MKDKLIYISVYHLPILIHHEYHDTQVNAEPTSLNDDLSSTFDDRINEKDKKLLDCPINDPDAILQIIFSGRQISVNWTIIGRSSLCYLSFHQSW